eukprot:3682853-Amphidinium_carterae.1
MQVSNDYPKKTIGNAQQCNCVTIWIQVTTAPGTTLAYRRPPFVMQDRGRGEGGLTQPPSQCTFL